MNNTKFVDTMLLMNAVLFHLNTLSKLFQKDHVLNLHRTRTWKHQIQNVQNLVLPWPCLGVINNHSARWRLCFSGVIAERGWSGQSILKRLLVNYTTTLERNLGRFQEAVPVLEAFSKFDPTCLSTSTFHSTNLFLFSRHHIPTISIAPFSAYKPTHNPEFLQSLWRRANTWSVSL